MPTNNQRAKALELLALRKVRQVTYEPYHFRLLWRFGFDLPPPHFAGFITNVLINGAFFGFYSGVIAWVFKWLHGDLSYSSLAGDVLIIGLTYGVGMAIYYYYSAARIALPKWRDLSS